MTDQEINKRIAEHLGWKSVVTDWFCSNDGGESGWLFVRTKEECEEYLSKIEETDWRYGSTIHPSMSLPPKYCEDLNLMHEAESVLQNQFSPMIEEAYWRNLQLVKPHPIYATAYQRAEAFLRTIGKWEE